MKKTTFISAMTVAAFAASVAGAVRLKMSEQKALSNVAPIRVSLGLLLLTQMVAGRI